MHLRRQRVVLTPGMVLREIRRKSGWSQKVLSKITGIAVANISNIENERSRLGEDRAIVIAEAFGLKPEFFLFPNGYRPPGLQAKLEAVRKKLKQHKSAS